MITEKEILENIQEIRRKKGFSQEYMASLLGVNQGTYSLWENGGRKLSLPRLLQIAIHLEENIANIITYSKNEIQKDEPIEAILQIKLQNEKKEKVMKLIFGDNNLKILNE